jgi:F0F1-type ATP synthase membrane subunit c/vacuolar-type H+-ATPase subunit K
VQGYEGLTPFVRVGDGLAVGLALLLAAAGFGMARRTR